MAATSRPVTRASYVPVHSSGATPSTPYGSSRVHSPGYIPVFRIDGRLICKGPTCNQTLDEKARHIYQTIEKVYQFFLQKFGMQGIDGKGGMAPIYVGWNEDNAAWECRADVQGKQCSWKFNDKYIDQPDVVAHEYIHAIVGSVAGLTYANQSGALDESIADVLGVTFKHWLTGNVDNWTIADRNLAKHPASAIPPVKKPSLANDYGGVHKNSLIPSHAYCAAVVKSKQELLIAKIWFEALKMASPNETFASFAGKTLFAAYSLASTSSEQKALMKIVASAWHHVDIHPELPSPSAIKRTRVTI